MYETYLIKGDGRDPYRTELFRINRQKGNMERQMSAQLFKST